MCVTNDDKKPMRLQVFLAHAGIASRRACEDIIAYGKVTVNGEVITRPGSKIESGDIVRVDGIKIAGGETLRYVVMNKPAGYICTNSDPQNRLLARYLLPPETGERLYTIGRLDFRSSGLIIWTNDGDFAAKVSHPSSEIEKEYVVEAASPVPDTMIKDFLNGITIDGIVYRCREIEKYKRKSLRIVLIEGKNREIRRVFSHFHLHPVSLRRVRIGQVRLGNLAEGSCRPLTDAERAGLISR